ncbi:MAG: bacteriocin [Saccharofermentans sp.]|nr:bacteriocin [Saccharofermentans sp.]
MDNKSIPSDDIKAKIEDIAKNRSNYKPLSAKELDEVSGGISVFSICFISLAFRTYGRLYY